MKLTKGFITQDIEDAQVMVAAGEAINVFHGIVRSNETAAFIVNCLKEETDRDRIVRAVFDEYDLEGFDNPQKTVETDVDRILEKLRSIGAIDEKQEK